MANINRRDFIKSSAVAMMSYSLPGCASALGSNEYDENYGDSHNYHNGRFKNLIETSEGPKPGTSLSMISEVIFGEEEREPDFELPVNLSIPSQFGHPFQSNSATQSNPNRPLIPTQIGHP